MARIIANRLLILSSLIVARCGRASPAASERGQKLAEAMDCARDLAALERAPDHRIHPGDDGGVEILLEQIDVVDAAPAAAWDIDAVGPFLRAEEGLARHAVLDRDRQPAYFHVALDAERGVLGDLDLLRREIFF